MEQYKKKKNFNYFKLFILLYMFDKDIWPKSLFHQLLLFFLLFSIRMFGGKSFFTLNFVKSIKNYGLRSFLR